MTDTEIFISLEYEELSWVVLFDKNQREAPLESFPFKFVLNSCSAGDDWAWKTSKATLEQIRKILILFNHSKSVNLTN